MAAIAAGLPRTASATPQVKCQAPRRSPPLSAHQLVKAIQDAGKQRRWQEALKLLDDLPRLEVEPSTVTFNAAAGACSRSRQWSLALHLARVLQNKGLEASVVTWNTCIAAVPQGTESWVRALSLLRGARVCSVRTDTVSQNSAADALGKVQVWRASLSLLVDELPRFGLAADSVTLGLTVRALGDGGLWQVALLRLLHRWPGQAAADLPLASLIGFSAALSALEGAAAVGSCGPWQPALGLLAAMRQRGLEPDTVALSAGISVCASSAAADSQPSGLVARSGRIWAWSLQLFDEIRRRSSHGGSGGTGPGLDAVAYSSAMSACVQGCEWELALVLFQELRSQGRDSPLRASVVSFSTAISACAQGQHWELALSLLAEMPSQKLAPNLVTYNSAMSACEKGLQWQRSLELLRFLQSNGPRPDIVSFGTAISACGQVQHWVHALALLEELRLCRLQANLIVLSAAISACEKGQQWRPALQLLREARSETLQPGTQTYNAAISACEKCGRWQTAIQLVEEMEGQSLKLSIITFSAAIAACEKGAAWDHALRLLGEAQDPDRMLGPPGLAVLIATAGSCESAGSLQQLPSLLSGVLHESQLRSWGEIAALAAATGLLVLASEVLQHHGCLPAEGHATLCRVCRPVQRRCRSLCSPLLFTPGSSSSELCSNNNKVNNNDNMNNNSNNNHNNNNNKNNNNNNNAAPAASSWRLYDRVLEGQSSIGRCLTAEVVDSNFGTQGSSCWLSAARAAARSAPALVGASSGLEEPSAKAITAWVAASLSTGLDGGQVQCPGRVHEWGWDFTVEDREQAGDGGTDGTGLNSVAGLLSPVFVEHDRSPHAERQGLLSLLQALANAGITPGGRVLQSAEHHRQLGPSALAADRATPRGDERARQLLGCS
ncbi:unnamed protein product [Polarella glacialis]|uniref:Pentatricopeptide repeat-containing protein, chloroplastic n=1 Tax=Polarella glacialis TaxID=89957 RepID=A0A813FQB4_POLGL|nr:unnamed protein product [Polarella glacialis]